jgi:predicted metal-dependent hydrolase
VRPIEPRSLEQLATENAEQGCVEETFGAAIAAVQARHAKEPTVRRLMRTIAREELAHAALAWDIARWLEGKLDDDARDRVRNARVAALRKLETGVAPGTGGDGALGLPGATAARAMLRRMWLPLASGELAAAVVA